MQIKDNYNLIGQKILIIHYYLSKFFKKYCTYHIVTIKYYIPSCNIIIVEGSDINRKRFTLVDHNDPFINGSNNYSVKKLATNFSKNDGWYYVFTPEESIKQLEYNLSHYMVKHSFNGSKIVHKDCCPLTTKERKTCFESLLKELKDESN